MILSDICLGFATAVVRAADCHASRQSWSALLVTAYFTAQFRIHTPSVSNPHIFGVDKRTTFGTFVGSTPSGIY